MEATLEALIESAKETAQSDPKKTLERLRAGLAEVARPHEFRKAHEIAWGDGWELVAELEADLGHTARSLEAFAQVPWSESQDFELEVFRNLMAERLSTRPELAPEFRPVFEEGIVNASVLEAALGDEKAELVRLNGDSRFLFRASLEAHGSSCRLEVVVSLAHNQLTLEAGCLAPAAAWPQLNSAEIQIAIYEYEQASTTLSKAAYLCFSGGFEKLALALTNRALHYSSHNQVARASREALLARGVRVSPGAEAMLSYLSKEFPPSHSRQRRPNLWELMPWRVPISPTTNKAPAYFLPVLEAAPKGDIPEKMGGFPDRFPSEHWPLCGQCQKAMSFWFQLAHHQARLNLGAAGRTLYVFVCSNPRCAPEEYDGGANKVVLLDPEQHSLGQAMPPSAVKLYPEAFITGWQAYTDPVPRAIRGAFESESEWETIEENPGWGQPGEKILEILDDLTSRTRLGGPPCWLERPKLPPAGFRFVGQFQELWPLSKPAAPSPDRRYAVRGPDLKGGIAYLFVPRESGPKEGRLGWQS
ncbi:MAG: hypothetical protein KC910_00535 [Candidatus Eremiobacteraeota bacterium]|nr:hypothetical protein [Candidatus Eremiobacteraeota bacterium]